MSRARKKKDEMSDGGGGQGAVGVYCGEDGGEEVVFSIRAARDSESIPKLREESFFAARRPRLN
jgi:hypothetical protein